MKPSQIGIEKATAWLTPERLYRINALRERAGAEPWDMELCLDHLRFFTWDDFRQLVERVE